MTLAVSHEEPRRSRYGLPQFAPPSILAVLTVAALSFVCAMQVSDTIWRGIEGDGDSYVFRYVARTMLMGDMPYRDTFDHKGPLLYLINAVGLIISPDYGVWLMELLTIFATFSCLYLIARLLCGRAVSCLATMVVGSLMLGYLANKGNYCEEYALPFIALALYIFLCYFLNARITRLRLMACGLSFAAVCLLRANMVGVWAVMCLAVLFKCIQGKCWRDLRFYLLYFALGFAALMAPILVWLSAGGALREFFDAYIGFNSLYTAGASAGARWTVLMGFLLQPYCLIALIVLAYGLLHKRLAIDGLCLLYLLVTLILLSISGRPFAHYGLTLVPALIFPFARLGAMLEAQVHDRGLGVLVGALVLLVAMPSFLLWTLATAQLFEQYQGRGDDGAPAYVRESTDIIRRVTTPDEQISVFGNMNILYEHAQRTSASRYSYQWPLLTDPSLVPEYYADLDANEPKVIVVDESYTYSPDQVAAFFDYLDSHGYNRMYTTTDGRATIYQKGA